MNDQEDTPSDDDATADDVRDDDTSTNDDVTASDDASNDDNAMADASGDDDDATADDDDDAPTDDDTSQPGVAPSASPSATNAPEVPAPIGVLDEIPAMIGAGSRLKPIVLRHGDVEQPLGTWWDEEAQAPCAMTRDGRCEFGSYPANIVFRDASCSEPLLRLQYAACYDSLPGWKRPAAAMHRALGGVCEAPSLYRAVGDPIPAPATLFQGNAESCNAFTAAANETFYEVEQVNAGVATSTFSVESRGTELDAYVRTADDGSWSVEGFYDTGRDWPCSPAPPDLSPAYTCIPEMSQGGWFRDDACAMPFAIPGEGSCSAPVAFPVIGALDGTCTPRSLELYRVGEPVEAVAQFGVGTTCSPLGEEPTAGFVVGDAIDVSALPKTKPLLGGEGRLQVPLVGVGSVPYRRDYARSTFFDTEANQGCREVLFADGSIYCVPESFTQETDYPVFADASCAGPRLFPRSNYACTPDYEGVVMNVHGCNTVAAEVFSVAPFESDTGYELSTDGQCTSFTITSKTPYYVTTGSIDPSEHFAELEAVIVQ